jgi:hypothetical protein
LFDDRSEQFCLFAQPDQFPGRLRIEGRPAANELLPLDCRVELPPRRGGVPRLRDEGLAQGFEKIARPCELIALTIR